MSIAAIQTHYLTKIAAGGCENIGQIYSFLGLLYMADGAKDNDSLNVSHLAIKNFIEKNTEVCTGPLIDEYLVKFEEYHYEKTGNAKKWLKNDVCHRTTKSGDATLPAIIYDNGTMVWFVDGKRHRDDRDAEGLVLPAEIHHDGTMVWYKEGKKHRDDKDSEGKVLPAEISSNGSKVWYKDGKRHRDDKDSEGKVFPAYIGADGSMHWIINGKEHRDDRDAEGKTLPAIIYAGGRKAWYINGLLDRDDVDEYGNLLPTEIFADGTKFWNKNGRQHRAELGKNPADAKTFGKAMPAIINSDGSYMWRFEGDTISCEKLTEKLKNHAIDCKGTTGLNIMSADGSVIKLTGSFVSVQLMSALHS